MFTIQSNRNKRQVIITMSWDEAKELGEFLDMELPKENLGKLIINASKTAVGF
jgi:hypothetical protein